MDKIYDVAIIGAGVSGASIARELSRYSLRVVILEKALDVAMGSSKANSGIVHAGYDCEPDTLMARLNVRGSQLMGDLCHDLGVSYENTGSLVIGFGQTDRDILDTLMKKGIANGVDQLQIVSGTEARSIEPALSAEVTCALYAPTASICSPYELCVAMCENAIDNGVELLLDAEVTGIVKSTHYTIESGDKQIEARYIVNAAGIYADEISRLAGAEEYSIIPRKGEYVLLDKSTEPSVGTVIFQTPSKISKGVLTAPTVHGNVFAGPTAVNTGDKEDDTTTIEGLEYVMNTSKLSVPDINFRDTITQFAGIRTVYDGKKDFYIEASQKQEHFVHVAGICSPGLSASAAIGEYVVEILEGEGLELIARDDFISKREVPTPFSHMTQSERQLAYQRDDRYGKVICRCETVTEAEIVDAIHGTVPALTIDSIKRRTRASMGRCQGGFCVPRIMDILCRELDIEYTDIVKSSSGSWIISSDMREDAEDE